SSSGAYREGGDGAATATEAPASERHKRHAAATARLRRDVPDISDPRVSPRTRGRVSGSRRNHPDPSQHRSAVAHKHRARKVHDRVRTVARTVGPYYRGDDQRSGCCTEVAIGTKS